MFVVWFGKDQIGGVDVVELVDFIVVVEDGDVLFEQVDED